MVRPLVVVTGGAGFIGQAVVADLVREQRRVTVVDRCLFPATPGVTTVVGDLRDPRVRDVAVPRGAAAIVHLAGLTSVLGSVADPVRTYEENVSVTQALLELARTREVRRFLLASTNAVTGDVGRTRISESTPLRPLTPYGATKAASEMLLSGYSEAYRLSGCALRFTNVYGAGMGHKDSFVPRLMRAARSGGSVRIHGDGRQRRDLVHVEDVARGVRQALDSTYTGPLILGSGRAVTVLDLVTAVRTVTGARLPVEHVPAPPGEMSAVVVDLSRSTETIGYRPRVGLMEGLVDTWHYFQKG